LLRQAFVKWIEQYLFEPNIFQKFIGILFLPLTLLYCIITTYKRISSKPRFYDIPVVSIGNLIIGGSGKTPITIELAKDYPKSAVVLRGYKRETTELLVVSHNNKILQNVKNSGDEAIVLAKALPNSTIIVSANRQKGIQKAKELGSKVVFLDDGYSKHNIFKLDILVRPKKDPSNIFCLPSGGYRDTPMNYSFVDIVLQEGKNFKREVKIYLNNILQDTIPKDAVLLTAISKPQRLLEFLPQDILMISYEDHYNFTQQDIDNITTKYNTTNIITTSKDMVKLETLNIKHLNIYLMKLTINIDKDIKNKVQEYVRKYTTKN
jgi:tetraacyldisaccharide 4'-kinase